MGELQGKTSVESCFNASVCRATLAVLTVASDVTVKVPDTVSSLIIITLPVSVDVTTSVMFSFVTPVTSNVLLSVFVPLMRAVLLTSSVFSDVVLSMPTFPHNSAVARGGTCRPDLNPKKVKRISADTRFSSRRARFREFARARDEDRVSHLFRCFDHARRTDEQSGGPPRRG